MNKQRRADLLLVMTTFFWGASYYLTDICLADLPPMTLNAFRFIVAFLVLGLIFWKHVVHINRTTLRYSLIVGLALAGTYVAYNYGITRTSLSNAAFICALQVIFAPLLGFLFFRQRPGWKLGVALVVCTVGMALLTLRQEVTFTVSSSIEYLSAAPGTGKLTAVGTVEKTGGHMGFSRTDIRDESGRLIAALRTVMYLTGRPLEL